MMRHHDSRHPGTQRPGKALVMFVLLMPILLGMVGLTIDGGLLLVTYRQVQNAADTAALAAAVDVKNGKSNSTAQTTAQTYVQTYNNMSSATTAPYVTIPPGSGPFAGNGNYAEAIVSYPFQTSFIQLLGVNASQTITARAVAGWEPQSAGEGVMTLGTTGTDLTVSGGTTLKVNGSIQVNSTDSSKAADVSSSTVEANSVDVAGTVPSNELSNFKSYTGGASTLSQNTGDQAPDPFNNANYVLPVPTTSNGVLANYYTTTFSNNQWTQTAAASPQAATINNSTPATLNPGIYTSITVSGGTASATFNPGIYVLMGGGLTIQGGATVTGNGVMFYNTASTYNSTTGVDGSGASYGKITISASPASLTGLSNSSSKFDGMLFFQDRNNTQVVTMSGDSGAANLKGTVYAPAANLTVSGGGNWGAQFITQTATFSGGSTITINYAGQNLLKAPFVFLVE